MSEIMNVESQRDCKHTVYRYLCRLINKEVRRNDPDRLLINRLSEERDFYLNWLNRLNRRLRVLARGA